MAVAAAEGYRLWSETYDETPNPLLALETRMLGARLGDLGGRRVLDAGSGTGRWMAHAHRAGALVFGVDLCHEMVLQAERKPGLHGRTALADIRAIPMREGAAELAICSFTLGYLESIDAVFRELARVSRRVVVSDLHPEAVRAGWTRSFRARDGVHELEHYEHTAIELDEAARRAGLAKEWRVEAPFGENERPVFQRAGKEALFERVRNVPAVLVTAWNRA